MSAPAMTPKQVHILLQPDYSLPETGVEEIDQAVSLLLGYAPYAPGGEDWVYRRQHRKRLLEGSLPRIIQTLLGDRWRSTSSLAWSALRAVMGREDDLDRMLGKFTVREWVGLALHSIHPKTVSRPNRFPDGEVGGAYTVWEETGEYIGLLPPHAGMLLAVVLYEERHKSHAQHLAAVIVAQHEAKVAQAEEDA